MMIVEGTLLGCESPSAVYSWEDGLVTKSFSVQESNLNRFFEVETWFAGGCRECQHSSNKGFVFRVAANQTLLLKSGNYLPVEKTQPGQRLVSDGECGYEEVRSVVTVYPEEYLKCYSVFVENGENYQITDGKRSVFLGSDSAE